MATEGHHEPHCAWIIQIGGGWLGPGQPTGGADLNCVLGQQVEDAISQTSQTLQLLVEHDPVSQRLDQLRLDARLSPHMQSARHSHTLSTLDTKENLEGTLRRRSLRCHLSPGVPPVCSPVKPSCCLLEASRVGREAAGQGRLLGAGLHQLPLWGIPVCSQGLCRPSCVTGYLRNQRIRLHPLSS